MLLTFASSFGGHCPIASLVLEGGVCLAREIVIGPRMLAGVAGHNFVAR